MSYTALYRKFRPQEFEDVKGQDHIVTTLKNQIKTDRIGHAYLFTGTRGTGKTTIAKIFAKAVNCEHPVDGSPCNECATCQAIAAGNSMNVIEIDAASNNGVNNIRDIIEEVTYAPTEGRYKVYIIDEVHMLSIGAFNALLKTLEEPPEYVIFILATTEVHKIPITILSRCQRYDFRRISIDTIANRLSELMEIEQVDVEERAIRYVAKAADGSMRDALSLLDQCIAFYLGQTLTYENVLKVLGAVDTEVFSRLLRHIMAQEITQVIGLIEEIVVEGRELGQFVIDFTWYLRNLLLVKSADDMEDVLELSAENLALLKEEAQMMEDEVLMRYIRILSELSNQMKYSSQKRVLLEIAMIKLCRPQMEEDYDSIIDRLSVIEKTLEAGVPVAVVPGAAQTGASHPVAAAPVEKKSLPAATPEEVQKACQQWKNILAEAGGMMRAMLSKALVTVSDRQELMLVFDATDKEQLISMGKMNRPETFEEVNRMIDEHVGCHVPLVIKGNDSGARNDQMYTNAVDYFASTAGIEIETEDF